ncbi:MAG: hypothetical protein R8P61_25205 [Bacteroidia bacterium]|nr:hypothetical protein [Bacteroidia bacterium]
MNSELRTLAKYRDPELARPISELLDRRGIPFVLEDASVALDVTFTGSPYIKEFLLRVPEQYFRKAQKIWEEDSEELIQGIDEDHYLYSFSDEELWEVLEKADEWSKLDFVLAKKILKDRGQEVEEKKIRQFEEDRLQELGKQATASFQWLLIGFMFSLVGGFIGMMIGYNFQFKKTLPNGTQIYAYDEASRKKGMAIFYLGLIVFVLLGMYITYTYTTLFK